MFQRTVVSEHIRDVREILKKVLRVSEQLTRSLWDECWTISSTRGTEHVAHALVGDSVITAELQLITCRTECRTGSWNSASTYVTQTHVTSGATRALDHFTHVIITISIWSTHWTLLSRTLRRTFLVHSNFDMVLITQWQQTFTQWSYI